MTTDTNTPTARGPKTTIADIAAHKDTIAVFAYTVGLYGSHVCVERHGHVEQWSVIAANLTGIAAQAEACDNQPIRLNVGDAQTVWYVRDGAFAVVVVLAKGSSLGKSVLRMARRSLKTMAAADKMDAVRGKVIADAAMVRDTLPSPETARPA